MKGGPSQLFINKMQGWQIQSALAKHSAIFGNVVWLLFEKCLTVGMVLLCDGILARSVTVADFGKWQYALNLASMLGCVGFVAGAEVVIPALSRHLGIRSEIITAGFIIRLIASAVTVLFVTLVSAWFIVDPLVIKLTIMAVVVVVLNEIGGVFTAYFQAVTQISSVVLCRLATLALRSTLFYLAYSNSASVSAFAIARWVESFVLLGLLTLIVKRRAIKWDVNRAVMKTLLHRGVRFLPPIVAMYAYTKIDRIYIEKYLSFSAVAVYSVAQQYVEQCFLVITIVLQSVAPRYIWAGKTRAGLAPRMLKIGSLLLAIAAALVGFTELFGDEFVLRIFGVKYHGSFGYMRVLIFSVLPFAVDSLVTQLFLRQKAANLLFWKWLAMLLLAIFVYEVVVPLIGVQYIRFVFLGNYCVMAAISVVMAKRFRMI